jgi:hypothetical protein
MAFHGIAPVYGTARHFTMKTDKYSTPHFVFQLLCLSSSAILACDEQPVDVDVLRAGEDDTTESSDSGPESEPPEDLGGDPETPENPYTPDEEGCHAIYAQDLLPTFELTIDDDIWDDLEWEWEHGAKQLQKGKDPDPYHPLTEFRYEDIIIDDAEIRLRGNPLFWEKHGKLQFQISFDRVDEQGHFLGLEALALDAAPENKNMLRDRLSLSIIRDMGIAAPCANHARININGEYYGIFTNLEKVDKKFLERTFVQNPTGDLWKRQSWKLKTNKQTANDDRLSDLLGVDSIEELATYFDIELSLKVYAAEAIIPDSDGGWAGGRNFYLYDDPISGVFKLIPYDMDGTFDRFKGGPNDDFPANPDPVVWHKKIRYHGRPWYDMALADDDWFWYYIDALEVQFETAYQVDVLHERINTWTDQIEESVLEDNTKTFSNDDYEQEVQDLLDYVEARHDWMVEWFECWDQGGHPNNKGYCVEGD